MSRTIIRLATLDDAKYVRDIYGPYIEESVVSFEQIVPSVEEMRGRMAAVCEKYPWLIAEVDGRVAGYAYGGRHAERAAYRWAADVTVYLDPAYHRRGIGRRLYSVLFDLLRLQGYRRAFGGISLPNEASVGLHESMGFTRVGVYHDVGYKMGRWIDVGWWEMPLQETAENPPEPIPFPQLRDSQEVLGLLDRQRS